MQVQQSWNAVELVRAHLQWKFYAGALLPGVRALLNTAKKLLSGHCHLAPLDASTSIVMGCVFISLMSAGVVILLSVSQVLNCQVASGSPVQTPNARQMFTRKVQMT